MTSRRLFWAAALASSAAALAARLAYRIDYAEELDSIRFLLALDRFDVAAYQPHFPGYPVFVFLGKVFLAFSASPVAALAALCAVSGGLLPLAVGHFARAELGDRAGAVAAALVAVNPLLWLHSELLLSDAPGVLFLFTALALFAYGLRDGSDRLLAAGCFVLGLTLGVRLSYFPFALTALALVVAGRRRSMRALVAASTGGVLAWLVPLVAVTGVGPLFDVAVVQGGGHFERWGGTIVTEPDLLLRAKSMLWELAAQGLGLWWPDRSVLFLVPTLALVGMLALVRWPRFGKHPLLLWGAPYFAWVFLGQNVVLKPRHSLPLVALLLVFGAFVVDRALASTRPAVRGLAAFAALLVAVSHAASGYALARAHQATPSNAVLAARMLGALCQSVPSRKVVVYTANLERHFRYEAPCVEVRRVMRLSQAERDFAAVTAPADGFVLSDVGNAERLGAPLLALHRDRYLQSALSDLSLYRLTPPAAPAAAVIARGTP